MKGNWLKLKDLKGLFLQDEICYLAYTINKCDLSPITEKLYVILSAPTPTNICRLIAFLGMLNYDHIFK